MKDSVPGQTVHLSNTKFSCTTDGVSRFSKVKIRERSGRPELKDKPGMCISTPSATALQAGRPHRRKVRLRCWASSSNPVCAAAAGHTLFRKGEWDNQHLGSGRVTKAAVAHTGSPHFYCLISFLCSSRLPSAALICRKYGPAGNIEMSATSSASCVRCSSTTLPDALIRRMYAFSRSSPT